MAYIEIGVLVLAISILLGFAHVDRKQELQRRRNKALADSLAVRLRVLESISMELDPLYRSNNIESFLLFALKAYLSRLQKLHSEAAIRTLVENWQKRVTDLTAATENVGIHKSSDSGHPSTGSVNEASSVDFRESKYLLKDLYGAVIASAQDGLISQNAAQKLTETVKALIIKVSVDTYDDAARQAEVRGDLNLAKHCYSMALKRLSEAANNSLRSAETVLKQKLRDIQAKLDAQSGGQAVTHLSGGAVKTTRPAIDEAENDDDSWQKRRF